MQRLSFEEMRDRLIRETATLIPMLLTKAKKSGYICPVCGNGGGANGTGITPRKKGTTEANFYCGVCGTSYDIIHIIEKVHSLDYPQALKKGYELLGLTPDAQANTQPPPPKKRAGTPKPKDYTAFFNTCKHISSTEYLRKRGISDLVADRAGVVYSDKLNAIVFKYGSSDYWLRYISDNTKEKGYLYPNGIIGKMPDTLAGVNKLWAKGSQCPLFNLQAVQYHNTLIVAEGQINALSFMECGHPDTIGLGSKSGYKTFIEGLQGGLYDRIKTFYICLDTDARAETAQMIQAIKERLPEARAVNITPYVAGNDSSDHDINYLLIQKGKEKMAKIIDNAITKATNEPEPELVELEQEIKEKGIKDLLLSYWDILHDEQKVEMPVSTGLPSLDAMLGGGLYDRRLYLLGAVSGAGKTSLATQIAEHIAEKGRDTYIFSVEMNKEELINRLISKHTAQRARQEGYTHDTPQEFYKRCTEGNNIRKYATLEETRQGYIDNAITDIGNSKAYNQLFIQADIMKLTIEDITQAVEKHKRARGVYPVVIVDYLQIIRPSKEFKSTRENIDLIVAGLKQLANMGLPVLVISSFNRENYDKPITFSAFKESGGIEYTADIVLGLQLAGMDRIRRASKNQRDKEKEIIELQQVADNKQFAKELEIVMLKNRIGELATPTNYYFYQKYSYFVDKAEEKEK